MSAPQIPNLLDSLRASKPSRGGRQTPTNSRYQTSRGADEVVQRTDDDAAGSRLSAVAAGYLDDDFAQTFALSQEPARRMPIINRGTYVRTTAIDKLVHEFLDKHAEGPTQIVSLGAGTDTRYFRLLKRGHAALPGLRYHEIDFAATTKKKIEAVERTAGVRALLVKVASSTAEEEEGEEGKGYSVTTDGTCFYSSNYYIHALDLRTLASSSSSSSSSFTSPPPGKVSGDEQQQQEQEQEANDQGATIPHLDPSTPTLLISECCLTYLPAETSTSLLTNLTQHLLPAPTPLYITLYEPLHPTDAFGRTMLSNLAARSIRLPGLEAFPTLDAHRDRLETVGFESSMGVSVRGWWEEKVAGEEKVRLRACEMVDEEEEWVLLAGHYGLVWAWRASSGGGGSREEDGGGLWGVG